MSCLWRPFFLIQRSSGVATPSLLARACLPGSLARLCGQGVCPPVTLPHPVEQVRCGILKNVCIYWLEVILDFWTRLPTRRLCRLEVSSGLIPSKCRLRHLTSLSWCHRGCTLFEWWYPSWVCFYVVCERTKRGQDGGSRMSECSTRRRLFCTPVCCTAHVLALPSCKARHSFVSCASTL